MFQSTPLREGRPLSEISSVIAICVSIHAPTRGATYASDEFCRKAVFQSTPLREGRRAYYTDMGGYLEFQSTPQRERRLTILSEMTAILNVSIHAPTRGATRYEKTGEDGLQKFQSTPLREGRQRQARLSRSYLSFNPRPYERGDRNFLVRW